MSPLRLLRRQRHHLVLCASWETDLRDCGTVFNQRLRYHVRVWALFIMRGVVVTSPPTASPPKRARVYCGCQPGPTRVTPPPRQDGGSIREPALCLPGCLWSESCLRSLTRFIHFCPLTLMNVAASMTAVVAFASLFTVLVPIPFRIEAGYLFTSFRGLRSHAGLCRRHASVQLLSMSFK